MRGVRGGEGRGKWCNYILMSNNKNKILKRLWHTKVNRQHMSNRISESNIKDNCRERIIERIIDCLIKGVLVIFTFKILIAN